MLKKVLVLQGGAVKGLLQASCIQKLSKAIDFNSFDFYAGTSVGAINASILALGKSPDEIVNLYPNLMDKIFTKSWYPRIPIYDRKNFSNIFVDLFNMPKMKDVKSKLMITTVERIEDMSHYYKSWEKKDSEEYVASCVLKSFAAPYFFGQFVDERAQKIFVDGGCKTDNLPLDETFTELVLQKWLNDDIELYVFGSGYVPSKNNFNDMKNDSFITQIKDFTRFGDGGSARATSGKEQVKRMQKLCSVYKNIKFKYYDIAIPESLDKFDAINKKSELIQYGELMAKEPLIQVN